jgi:hypothetical protein
MLRGLRLPTEANDTARFLTSPRSVFGKVFVKCDTGGVTSGAEKIEFTPGSQASITAPWQSIRASSGG